MNNIIYYYTIEYQCKYYLKIILNNINTYIKKNKKYY